MKENIIQIKSFKFAIRIINLYRYLTDTKKEFVLSKQILRCGTSIGANIEEAIGGQSSKDFISKLEIAYKETREAHYWIRLLQATNFITVKEAESLLEDCEELLKIITSIKKTAKRNNS